MTKSPLRWAGSKRSLLPNIRAARPDQVGRYIEPFMGSACVFFDLSPAHAQLSDFNSDLVQFFRELRDSPDELIRLFQELDPHGADYYAARELWPSELEPAHRAARFLYLNRFAFNGVYRTNRKGQFNVPRGVRTGELPTQEELLASSAALKDVDLFAVDYRTATANAKPGDFVYLDPPYRNTARATFGEYGYGSFSSESDVRDLAVELTRLDELGANVLLSFNDDDGLAEALDGWEVVHISRRRSVAGAVASRTELRGEILAMNYQPGAAIA